MYLQGSGETEQNELYTFHEAVSQLQDAEEQLVECHKKSVEVCDTGFEYKDATKNYVKLD